MVTAQVCAGEHIGVHIYLSRLSSDLFTFTLRYSVLHGSEHSSESPPRSPQADWKGFDSTGPELPTY